MSAWSKADGTYHHAGCEEDGQVKGSWDHEGKLALEVTRLDHDVLIFEKGDGQFPVRGRDDERQVLLHKRATIVCPPTSRGFGRQVEIIFDSLSGDRNVAVLPANLDIQDSAVSIASDVADLRQWEPRAETSPSGPYIMGAGIPKPHLREFGHRRGTDTKLNGKNPRNFE